MHLDYRFLRWLQIAAICLVAGAVMLLLFGPDDWQNWIFIAGAVIFGFRALIEYRHIDRES